METRWLQAVWMTPARPPWCHYTCGLTFLCMGAPRELHVRHTYITTPSSQPHHRILVVGVGTCIIEMSIHWLVQHIGYVCCISRVTETGNINVFRYWKKKRYYCNSCLSINYNNSTLTRGGIRYTHTLILYPRIHTLYHSDRSQVER